MLLRSMLPCLVCHALQEFSERWEVDKYLSASGYLPPSVKPFFVGGSCLLPDVCSILTVERVYHLLSDI